MVLLGKLKLREKLLIVVLPLVIIPILIVGIVVGYVSTQQAHLGITRTTQADLEHIAQFTLDLLAAHHQQFQVYKEDKRLTIQEELATLVTLAHNLILAQQQQSLEGREAVEAAQKQARRALKGVNIGETGYLYVINPRGDLLVHVAREGDNIYDAQDETGRYFIREMTEKAVATPGAVLYITYPWRNELLGEQKPRVKMVAYQYFQPWDWIIAAGGYLDETYEDPAFERRAFQELEANILNKKVGATGYIYAIDRSGLLKIHPFQAGKNIIDSQDHAGHEFIREMIEKKNGWIRYPWKNAGELAPRMKIVHYRYFEPWDWIIAVGSYEEEFYHEADRIKERILLSMTVLTGLVVLAAATLVLFAAKVLTDPIRRLIAGVREVRRGRLDTQLPVESSDELGELAADFNRMTHVLRQNKELEASLTQHNKMASLGVLSAGVAHEINNPLGVILGYASYLETKVNPDDPNYKYVQEIKRESKRCKNIVQDLLSYARVPKPSLEETDINALLEQIVDFTAHHTDMDHVTVDRQFAADLPLVWVDKDQIRQVAVNLMLNAGAAMAEGGTLTVRTTAGTDSRIYLSFEDDGAGIPEENLQKIFEPFFTTKARGTGLGLAITKTIIDQHHGTIAIVSEVGRGTTVTVGLVTDPRLADGRSKPAYSVDRR